MGTSCSIFVVPPLCQYFDFQFLHGAHTGSTWFTKFDVVLTGEGNSSQACPPSSSSDLEWMVIKAICLQIRYKPRVSMMVTCGTHLHKAEVWRWQGRRLDAVSERNCKRKNGERLHPWRCSTSVPKITYLCHDGIDQHNNHDKSFACHCNCAMVCNSAKAIFYSFDVFCICLHKKALCGATAIYSGNMLLHWLA